MNYYSGDESLEEDNRLQKELRDIIDKTVAKAYREYEKKNQAHKFVEKLMNEGILVCLGPEVPQLIQYALSAYYIKKGNYIRIFEIGGIWWAHLKPKPFGK